MTIIALLGVMLCGCSDRQASKKAATQPASAATAAAQTQAALPQPSNDAIPIWLEILQSPKASARLAAAEELGKAQDFRAMRPLIHAGGYDEDANVRQAAIEAVISFRPQEEEMRRSILKALASHFDKVKPEGFALADVFTWFTVNTRLSSSIQWGELKPQGLDPETHCTLEPAENLSGGELLCRLVDSLSGAGFVFRNGRLCVGTVDGLATTAEADRKINARRLELREYCERTEAGRKTLAKLQARIETPAVGISCSLVQALRFLEREANVAIDVDWLTLMEVGWSPDQQVDFGLWREYDGREKLDLTVEDHLWRLLHDRPSGNVPEFIVIDEAVIVTSPQRIDRYLKEKSDPSR